MAASTWSLSVPDKERLIKASVEGETIRCIHNHQEGRPIFILATAFERTLIIVALSQRRPLRITDTRSFV